MNKLLQVKEFDSITDKIKYRDYVKSKDMDKYKYLEPKVFQELLNYIHEQTKIQKKASDFDILKIQHEGKLEYVIKVQNYVGLIQLKSGYQIEILPKVEFNLEEDPENERTKIVFLKMLRSLNGEQGKTFNSANLNMGKMNLYEIIINMYLQEVRHLVKRGIKSDYITQEDNLRYYKGKLLIQQHIKENLCHKERFYVSYDEFHPDRAENRLIKATLLKLQKFTNSARNSKEIRQLLLSFEMVTPSVNYQKDFSKVVINRNTKDYETLMKWSKIFLQGLSFTTFSGNNTANALLFPMEKIYESYVAYHIKKIFRPNGWEVSAQDEKYYLFDINKKFAIKPDIVCSKGNRIIIMDTKWKRLNNIKAYHYGIDQADLYQMYAYAKKYGSSEVWLLYPFNNVNISQKELEFRSSDDFNVSVYFIDVANIEDNLTQLKMKIES